MKLSKRIIILLLSGFAAYVVIAAGIHIYFYESLPNAPDEGKARTYRLVVNHGFVRYGSEGEFRALKVVEGSFPIAGFMFFAALALGLRYGHFQIRRGSAP